LGEKRIIQRHPIRSNWILELKIDTYLMYINVLFCVYVTEEYISDRAGAISKHIDVILCFGESLRDTEFLFFLQLHPDIDRVQNRFLKLCLCSLRETIMD